MESLRLILLLIGAIVIVGVYLYSRRGSASIDSNRGAEGALFGKRSRVNAHDTDDEFLDDDLPPLSAIEREDFAAEEVSASETVTAKQAATTVSPDEELQEKIIVLNILPVSPGEVFPGADLLDVFDRAGLEYGQYDVFHRISETAEGPRSVFSIASATEPGSFDITTMADESFRGLSLFMLLPGPMRGVDAFADMLATARRIAEQIRGEVTDRNRSTLTRQTAHHIREEIIAFEHLLQRKN